MKAPVGIRSEAWKGLQKATVKTSAGYLLFRKKSLIKLPT